ncbi:MAG: hypothetical protein WAT43_13440 [Chitinophagales bacterium]
MTSVLLCFILFINQKKEYDYYKLEYNEETNQFIDDYSNRAIIDKIHSRYQLEDSISIEVAYCFLGEYDESTSGSLAFDLWLKLGETFPYTKVILTNEDRSIYPGVYFSTKNNPHGFRYIRIKAYTNTE